MPRCIIHNDGLFFEWSTIVDAPVSPAMTREEFWTYYKERHGTEGLRDLEPRLARAEGKGCSSFNDNSAEECVSGNRAGEGETELSFSEIVDVVKRGRKEYGLPTLS